MPRGEMGSIIASRTSCTCFAIVKMFFILAFLVGCDSGFKAADKVAQLSAPVISTSTCTYTYTPTQACMPNGTQAVSVASSSPASCTGTPLTTQNCNYVPPACDYTYTSTQACQPNGTQTVSVASTSPSDCVGTPVTTQNCTYVPPTCSYTYTPQACQPSGMQTVSVASSTPAGCVGTPVTTQSCHYTPASCMYTYSPTQVCQPNGTQTVSVASSSPSGCVGTPVTTQSCHYTPTSCMYTYTPTQACQSNGMQTVSVTSSTPSGCVGNPATTQTCTYVPPACNYTYTPTQVCQSNSTQTVSVASSAPAGCMGTPVTMQNCNYVAPPVVNSFTSSDSSITSGQQLVLSWNVTSATTVSISVAGIYTPLNQAGANSLTLSPLATTNYLLTASNAGGSVTSQVTVTVAPPVCSANTQQSCQIGNGTGSQTCNSTGSAWGTCGNVTSCNSGYVFYNGACSIANPTNSFLGQYYNNMNLSGSPSLVRSDANIIFRWGYGDPGTSNSPAPGIIPATQWSAQWQGSWNFINAGTYRFYATTDDGIKVWVDGNLIINEWFDQSETTYTADLALTSGMHNIQVNYYNDSGAGTAIFSWAQAPTNLLAIEKAQACTADGLLWDGPDDDFGRVGIPNMNDYQSLIARSKCGLLSRAIETWFIPPNFTTIQSRLSALQSLSGGKGFIYSMSIAEALYPAAVSTFFDPLTNTNLSVADMCQPGTDPQTGNYNQFGIQGSCVPSYFSPVYQQYLRSITQQAINMGVQDFVFGEMDVVDSANLQLDSQGELLYGDDINSSDNTWSTTPIFPLVFAQIRAYAFSKGIPITIGCQIGDKNGFNWAQYSELKLCDYKDSPLLTGNVNASTWTSAQWDNPSSAANWSNGDWNNPGITSQTSVLADFEWWGVGDDITLYSQQQKTDRMPFAFNAHAMLAQAGQGLMMPFIEPLATTTGVQCGAIPNYPDGSSPTYSPSNTMCGDEDVLNAALSGSPVYIFAGANQVSSGGGDILYWSTGPWSTSQCTVYWNSNGLFSNGTIGYIGYPGSFWFAGGLGAGNYTFSLACPNGNSAQATINVQ